MVTSVHKVEAPPLRNTEWTKGEVGEATSGVKAPLCLTEDFVHAGEPRRDG